MIPQNFVFQNVQKYLHILGAKRKSVACDFTTLIIYQCFATMNYYSLGKPNGTTMIIYRTHICIDCYVFFSDHPSREEPVNNIM